MEELYTLKQLQSLDVKNNLLEDREEIIPFFERIQTLHALYLKGNPCTRKIAGYRKSMVAALKNLNYLDDRPVYDYERLVADALARGGPEEEAKVKQEMQDKKAAEE